ncbi:MAG: RNA polymerase factor sigma-54 [Candidatus Schekmanbacteria bacterium]|nr:RNA polymerase factor sigma-54 [Candidatus Schekmanbacteria bacterium]
MLDLRLQMKLQQKLVMTPQLRQAIKLLQLSKIELVQQIEQELMENPMLEAGGDLEAGQSLGDVRPEEAASALNAEDSHVEATPEHTSLTREDVLNWDDYLNDGRDLGYTPREVPDQIPYENVLRHSETLEEYLTWQLELQHLSEAELTVAKQLAGNLDSKGYLAIGLEEVAVLEGYPLEEVERILKIVQHCDPVGVAARNVQECLLIQLEANGRSESLAAIIIRDCLPELERRAYADIAKKLECSVEDVNEAFEEIQLLEPKPGRHYSSDPPRYVVPDIRIVKIDGEYKILLNDYGIPQLRISPLYRTLLAAGEKVPEATKEYVEKKVNSARWLMKSVQQRQRTIYKVAESILVRQKDFFDNGISHLKPMVLRDVAQDIGVHESTVSRVSTSKYMHTPQGIFEIKYFFHGGLSHRDGVDVSSLRVKEMIKNLVAAENRRRPLSDQNIAKYLMDRGIEIARRTVAKYREELNIPPSSRRKKVV